MLSKTFHRNCANKPASALGHPSVFEAILALTTILSKQNTDDE